MLWRRPPRARHFDRDSEDCAGAVPERQDHPIALSAERLIN
jgi:hypothetical protein